MATIDRRGAVISAADPPIATNPNPDLAWKAPVRVATTGANINLTAGGLLTIDGVVLAAGDRVLVKDQTDATANGLYNAATGPWTRTIDAANNSQWAKGVQVVVTDGTLNATSNWQCTTASPITLGTSTITFAPSFAPSARKINTTAPLAGGGDLTADRTLSINANGITNALLAQMAGDTLKGNNTDSTGNVADLTAFKFIGNNPSLSISPTGNSTTTLSTVSVQGTTGSSTTREYLVNFGLVNNTGNGVASPGGDKVTLYAGIECASGGGQGWAFNGLALLESGFNNNGYVAELDVQNNSQNWTTGLSSPGFWALNLSVNSMSSFYINGAVLVSGANGAKFDNGIAFTNSSIRTNSILENTSSTTAFRDQGTHTYGIDLQPGTYSGAPIRLPNNTAIMWRNAANGADLNVINVNVGNNLVLGQGAGQIINGQTTIPISNNTQDLGFIGTNRWLNLIASVLNLSPPNTQTGNYTVATTDSSLIFNGAGSITVTLPAASSFTGRWLNMKTIANQTVISNASNVVPLAGGAAGTAILPATAGKWAALQSDGTNWIIMAGN